MRRPEERADKERIKRLTDMMARYGFDALICHLPQNVLMLSGYLPVSAQSVIVFLPDGEGVVIAPESESFFAQDGWFSEIRTFNPITLDHILSPSAAIAPLLAEVCCEKGISDGVLGMEWGDTEVPAFNPTAYKFGRTAYDQWAQVLPGAEFRNASPMLTEAEKIKTPLEIERVRIACKFAEYGFEAAKEIIEPGVKEAEVAAVVKSAVEIDGTGRAGVRRVGAWAYCMSGQRSAEGYNAAQYSTNRHIEMGDVVVVQIKCHADGFWTDMTRTFFACEPDVEQRKAYNAILDAWDSATSAVSVGVKARDVDLAARSVLNEKGYSDGFPHGTGHGIGFNVSPGSIPVIHPRSEDNLENDMVFNIEPGIYLDDRWGISVGDVISVRGDKGIVLSDMRRDLDWAVCL